MAESAKEIVEAAYKAWSARDIERALANFAVNAVLVLHIPKELMPTAGETKGKEAIVAAFQGILDQFDFMEFRPTSIAASGHRVDSTVHFHYRHKLSGEQIESDLRHEWTIEDGKVVRLEEWHDLGRLAPFFTTVAKKLSGIAGAGA